MIPEDVSLLYSVSTEPPNRGIADEYLRGRGISSCSDIGYMKVLPFRGKFYPDMIVMFSRNSMGDINGVYSRGRVVKEFQTIWQDDDQIPIFGRINPGKTLLVVVESIMDCLTFKEYFPDEDCVALLTANPSLAKKYVLAIRGWGRKFYFALDNDSAGIGGMKDCREFLLKKFGIQSEVLDFPGKDFNSLCSKYGGKFFCDTLRYQLRG